MLWREKVEIICMTTGIVEKGKPKCERYWPAQPDEDMQFGDIIVKTVETQVQQGFLINILRVNLHK
jgi:protein-tyrosine phosphatase